MTNAVELARRAGVSPKTFRAWLRDLWRAGDIRLREHRANSNWIFDDATAESLLADFRAGSSEAALARFSNPHRSRSTDKIAFVRDSTFRMITPESRRRIVRLATRANWVGSDT